MWRLTGQIAKTPAESSWSDYMWPYAKALYEQPKRYSYLEIKEKMKDQYTYRRIQDWKIVYQNIQIMKLDGRIPTRDN